MKCVACGSTALVDEEDLQRYQQFESEQPGVLERINSEQRE